MATATKAGACSALQAQLSTQNGLGAHLEHMAFNDITCASARMSDDTESSYCYAIFPYRAPAARRAFDQLSAELSGCFAPLPAQATGVRVNHPDSFEQTLFCAPGSTLSLSVKDKAALNQTLIFLRLDSQVPGTTACASN